MQTNLKKIRVKFATVYYHEVIDGLYESSVNMRNQLMKNLQRQAAEIEADDTLDPDDKEQLLSSLDDERYIAHLTTELAGEMMIVALFKTSEISIKEMAIASELFTKNQINKFLKFCEWDVNLKEKLCDITTLNNYNSYDELRLINNCIKHSGKVNKSLASYPGWIKGNKLDELDMHYHRLKGGVIKFVNEIQDAIIRKIP
ncbi:hypothetical protein ABF87_08225 [Nitrosomonas sp. JL21]|uniref:hypothetical protein n=1 Tax=Nitrosomonas sp. JL21 TaxID=153949 RepID=UPI00136EDCD8|nr:hypothetical protein [Nitrosomonas sp. JL21]MXS77947.1 hypothetical protein [Nitrosomonas sp. JL21]